MAYTLRNVSRAAHTPTENKLLTGETGKGIGSVKRIVKEQEKLKAAQKTAKEKVAETEAA